MITDLLQLLKNVCSGDEQAWLTLKKLFDEKKLSEDEQKQAFLYVKQAAKSNVYAIYIQGFFYDMGLGIRQDIEMAYLLMREAAGHGHSAATFEVGRRFLYGVGIEKSEHTAFQWLTLAATSPHYHPAAMHYLGLMYEHGMGVPQNLEKAKEWKEKAAVKGYKG
ncbi:MAG: tetratricopeptide repeat protein [Gammaproteobacteria bacterium]